MVSHLRSLGWGLEPAAPMGVALAMADREEAAAAAEPLAMAEADDAFLRAFLVGRWLAVAAIPVAVAVEGLTMPNPPGPNMGHQTNRPQPN